MFQQLYDVVLYRKIRSCFVIDRCYIRLFLRYNYYIKGFRLRGHDLTIIIIIYIPFCKRRCGYYEKDYFDKGCPGGLTFPTYWYDPSKRPTLVYLVRSPNPISWRKQYSFEPIKWIYENRNQKNTYLSFGILRNIPRVIQVHLFLILTDLTFFEKYLLFCDIFIQYYYDDDYLYSHIVFIG